MNRSTQKMFAVASCIGSALKAMDDKSDFYKLLDRQVNLGMKVFNKKDPEMYWKISKDVSEVWGELAKERSNTIPEDTIVELVNAFSNLVPEKAFKAFLKHPQPSLGNIEMSKEHFKAICDSALRLDTRFNELFGTKSYRVPLPVIKKEKIKKTRDKSKKVIKEKTISKSKLKEAKRKENVRSFLKDRIAKAKENK
ncbi:MAG: hypothetical protein U9R50_10100 [Campylobacterota bacterium]|nr:hypothetical protein [Campylobacterota bacterium]